MIKKKAENKVESIYLGDQGMASPGIGSFHFYSHGGVISFPFAGRATALIPPGVSQSPGMPLEILIR